jgi:hypothetical protein
MLTYQIATVTGMMGCGEETNCSRLLSGLAFSVQVC